jgi:hypothetical protein
MSKRPHGGRTPNPRIPPRLKRKDNRLFIDDIQDALDRIWKRRKKPKAR